MDKTSSHCSENGKLCNEVCPIGVLVLLVYFGKRSSELAITFTLSFVCSLIEFHLDSIDYFVGYIFLKSRMTVLLKKELSVLLNCFWYNQQ
jgi:hypothetical protein